MKKYIMALVLMLSFSASSQAILPGDILTKSEVSVNAMQVPVSGLHEKGKEPVVLYRDNNWFVKQGSTETLVESINLDRTLRQIDDNIKINTFINNGYVRVRGEGKNTQLTGEYRLNGGGLWGAWAGATAAHFIFQGAVHTTIYGIATVAGALTANPAVTVFVGAGLNAVLQPVIHTGTLIAVAAGGIAGGVATGPV